MRDLIYCLGKEIPRGAGGGVATLLDGRGHSEKVKDKGVAQLAKCLLA